MANITLNMDTTLDGEEVLVRSVQFFTNERWRAQSQSARVATFVGRPPIPWFMLILTLVGFMFFILPGVIMYFLVIRKVIRLQNIVVTVTPRSVGCGVVVNCPEHARSLVARFFEALPTLEGDTRTQENAE